MWSNFFLHSEQTRTPSLVLMDPSHLSALVPEELARVLDDLFVGQQAVRLLLTQSEDFPQRHAKRPHVARRGELPLQEAAGCLIRSFNLSACWVHPLTSRMLSQAIQRMGSTARPWIR